MKKLLLTITLFSATFSFAACPSLYPKGVEITVPGTVELCNTFYVSRYDTGNRAVIMTSERIKRGSKFDVLRVDSFRADTRVSNAVLPSEYSRTGLDRGHMAPADDSTTSAEMRDTFLMTNMTPQEPTLNRGSWKSLETRARTMTSNSASDSWIVTVAVYSTPSRMIGRGVPVPVAYWKFVIVAGKTVSFYVENKPYAKVEEKMGDLRMVVSVRSTF